MAKHPHIVRLAEVPVEEIKAPPGSLFGGRRRRVGAHIGARKLGYSFFAVAPGKAAKRGAKSSSWMDLRR